MSAKQQAEFGEDQSDKADSRPAVEERSQAGDVALRFSHAQRPLFEFVGRGQDILFLAPLQQYGWSD
jgi:hypothetical protein